MQINNFKRLQEEEERAYTERHEHRVKSGLLESLNAFRLVGQLIDMYLPKIFSLFVIATGGKVQAPPARPTSIPPSQILSDDIKERKPGTPGTEPFIR